MPLTNYTDLQSEVANWANRTDLTSQIPSFVKAAEVGINRLIRINAMDQETTLTVTTRTVAFPANMIELKYLAIINANNSRNVLTPLVPGDLDSILSTVPSRMSYYCVRNLIEFDCTPDQTYSVACRYWKGFDLITDGSNALMTSYPDVYLYSTLQQLAVYLKQADAIGMYSQMAINAIQSANLNDARSKNYITRTELASGGAFDIVRGQ